MHQDFNNPSPPSGNPNNNFHNQNPFQQTFLQLQELTYLKKQLILQCSNYSYAEQFTVNIPYIAEKRSLDIGQTLTEIFTKVLHLETTVQVFHYSTRNQYYVYDAVFPFEERVLLGEEYAEQSVITVMFRYFGMTVGQGTGGVTQNHLMRMASSGNVNSGHQIMINSQSNSTPTLPLSAQQQFSQVKSSSLPPFPQESYQSQKIPPSQLSKPKIKRKTDRTIGQVLEKVSQWRFLNQNSESMTLYSAAKLVQIPKKTLDDYYFQIKIGEQFGFNFQKNLDSKIGVLRKFVKEQKNQIQNPRRKGSSGSTHSFGIKLEAEYHKDCGQDFQQLECNNQKKITAKDQSLKRHLKHKEKSESILKKYIFDFPESDSQSNHDERDQQQPNNEKAHYKQSNFDKFSEQGDQQQEGQQQEEQQEQQEQ